MRTIAYTFLLIGLSGCGFSGTPSCSDTEVKRLAAEIAGDILTENGINKPIGLNLQAVRTRETDDEARQSHCAAELHSSTGRTNWDVEYIASVTDDNRIYVELSLQ